MLHFSLCMIFVSYCNNKRKFDCVSVAGFIGHSIIREKRNVRRFISYMPDEMHLTKRVLLYNCIVILFNSVNQYALTFSNFARRTIAEINFHYSERKLLYFIAHSKYHLFVTLYVTYYRDTLFYTEKRCWRV